MAEPEYRAAVLTVSDGVSAGTRKDTAGPAAAAILRDAGFAVEAQRLCRDEREAITEHLRQLATAADLVVSVGGTGLAERDVTPEATLALTTRIVPGIAERMRAEGSKSTHLAYLSRALAVTYQKTLILNLPGSVKGASESLKAVLPLLPHALELLRGHTEH